MHDQLAALLQGAYSIHITSLQEVPGGWCAAAYQLEAREGSYFLKCYDKRRQSVGKWIARMDAYLPVTRWLHINTPLGGNMACPLSTKSGHYKVEDENFVYLLFPLIAGETPGDRKLSSRQIQDLARIIATLHQYGEGAPVATTAIRESFDTSFCADLNRCIAQANNLAGRYRGVLQNAVTLLGDTAQALRADPPPFVLCHTDLHGWNLIQSASLILVDWEGLSLAPAEADLFAFTEGFFFGYARGAFMGAYQSARSCYQMDHRAMRYYQIRRRLTDIHEFLDSVLHDRLSEKDRQQSVQGLLGECEQLAPLLR